MQIRTIGYQLDYAERFDEAVNTAIREGWTLTKREIIVPNTEDKKIMVYAEMIKQ